MTSKCCGSTCNDSCCSSCCKCLQGSSGFGILGDSSLSFYRDPVGFTKKYADKHAAPVFLSRFLGKPTVFVCSNQAVYDLLYKNSDKTSMGYKQYLHHLFGDNILFSDGDEGMMLRQALSSVLNDEQSLEIFKSKEARIIKRFFDLLDASKPVCVYETMKKLVTRLCVSLFLDIDPDADPEIIDNIGNLSSTHLRGVTSVPLNLKLPWSSGGGSGYSKALKAKEQLLTLIRRRISETRTTRSKSLNHFSHSAAADEAETKSLDCDAEIKTKTVAAGTSDFVTPCGGFVPSMCGAHFPSEELRENHSLLLVCALIPKAFSSILTSFIISLDQHKEDLARCKEDDTYLEHCLLECTRLWPPYIGGRRVVDKECVIDRVKIPSHMAAVYITYWANRDPKVFDRPNDFNPSRWTDNKELEERVLTFGGGARGCIGKQLSWDILVNVARLLVQTFTWSLNPGQDLMLKYIPATRPKASVLATFSRK